MGKIAELFNSVTLSAWLAGAVYGLFGDKAYLVGILILFVAVDFITGILISFVGKSMNTVHGRFSSRVCYRGLVKKSLIMVMLLVAIGVDRAMGNSHILRDATLLFFIANEGMSILENAAVAGLPLPRQLKRALERMYDDDDDEG